MELEGDVALPLRLQFVVSIGWDFARFDTAISGAPTLVLCSGVDVWKDPSSGLPFSTDNLGP